MRIWIDGQCFQTASRVRGIGRYVIEFIRSLTKYPENAIIVGINGSLKEEAITAIGYLKSEFDAITIDVWYGIAADLEVNNGYSFRRMADARIISASINNTAPDIVISPSPFEGFYDHTSPLLYTYDVHCPTACIFHDAIPHRFPEHYLRDERFQAAYYRRLTAVAQFDLILCNSEFTRSEYIDIFGKSNAVSIGAGLPKSFQQLIECDSDKTPLPDVIDGKFVLYVGGVDWRKNILILADAMALVPQCRAGELSLVLAGDHPAIELVALRKLWHSHDLPERGLLTTGWISDAQLVKLYRSAALAVQPSLMEGFGLSALEAMASGCAFLAARCGAVSEVVANETLLFDGHDAQDLAAKIAQVLDDAAFRAEVIGYGLERSTHFQWRNSAATVMTAATELVLSRPAVGATATPARQAQPASRQLLLMDVTSTAQAPYLTGIQRVIRCLAQALLAANDRDGPETVLTYADDESGWYRLPRIDRAAIVRDPRQRLVITGQDSYLLLDSSWDYTAAQRPRLLDALVMGQEVIHGVHDIGPLRVPAMMSGGMPPHFRRWFDFVLGHSTGILCVSRAVADEVYGLIELIKLPRPMKVGYIQLGADVVDVEPQPDWLDFLGGRPFFLMVGTLEPRKGHPIALRAFEQLWARGVEVNLLILGGEGWYTRLLREQLGVHPEAERRLFVRQGANDGELRAAYEAATALIMASYLEGFGLPVVEAGRHGCPAILSDIPVFREVGEGAPLARFFPVGDSPALAGIIADMATTGHRDIEPFVQAWPDWQGTARQVDRVIFGDDWYRRYTPAQFVPNAETNNVGRTGMRDILAPADRAHHLCYVEGPMISDDGHEIQFIVAVRNLGTKAWSSHSDVGGGLEINIGSHIYAANDVCIAWDTPRSSIPFVLGPGEDILVPVRLPSDYLARGATSVDVELVQEGAGWFGNQLRLALLHPSHQKISVTQIGNMSDLLAISVRPPFRLNDNGPRYMIFMLVNRSYAPVDLANCPSDAFVQMLSPVIVGVGQPGCDFTIIAVAGRIAPAGTGLLAICLA